MSTSRIVSLALMLMAVVAAGAQTVVSGLVRDAQTGKVLSSVSIMAEGSSQHTVTNDEGRFRLRVPRQPHYLLLSHVGYQPLRVRLFSGQNEQLEILMTQGTVQLSELVVSVANPYELVREAMRLSWCAVSTARLHAKVPASLLSPRLWPTCIRPVITTDQSSMLWPSSRDAA